MHDISVNTLSDCSSVEITKVYRDITVTLIAMSTASPYV